MMDGNTADPGEGDMSHQSAMIQWDVLHSTQLLDYLLYFWAGLDLLFTFIIRQCILDNFYVKLEHQQISHKKLVCTSNLYTLYKCLM